MVLICLKLLKLLLSDLATPTLSLMTSVTPREGDNIILKCSYAENNYPAITSISFYRENTPLLGSEEGDTLRLNNVSREDAGNYQCVIANSLSTKSSNNMFIHVRCK